ncbi:alpha-latrotoxin-Sg1a-like [Hydra vulgaris]|uniref:alpha-latrotoxin-Sg1a-like n=1 Tax=Hydra vulgaris TaxID=6087 RepID=UPI0032E9D683
MNQENKIENNNFLIKNIIEPSSQIYYITTILKNYGYKKGNKVDFAVKIGKLDLIKLLFQIGEKGDLEVLKYLRSIGYRGTELTIAYAIDNAAINGHLEILKYLHSIGYKGEEWTINYAAENGHLEVLKYLRSLGYRVTEWTISSAAKSGNLDMIKYLHSLGYKGTKDTVYFAAMNDHLEVVKYLIELGYECDEWIINDVELKGKNAEQLLKVLIDLHSIGYKGTEKAIFHAKLAGYLEAFEYLHSIGYSYS